MGVWDYVSQVGALGMPLVASGLVLWLFQRQARRAEEREDKLLEIAVHGRQGEDGTTITPGLKDLVRAELDAALEPLRQQLVELRALLGSRPCLGAPRTRPQPLAAAIRGKAPESGEDQAGSSGAGGV
jgi:hypothetical protein